MRSAQRSFPRSVKCGTAVRRAVLFLERGRRPSRGAQYRSVKGMTMRSLSVFGGALAGTLILLGAVGAARAQDEPQTDQSQMLEQLGEEPDQASNPPGRAAQLSYAEGSVSLEPAGTSSWTNAVLNRP